MKTVILRVKSPFVIDGDIVKKGALVEMTEKEARQMLDRNKVDLATDADLKKAGVYRGIKGEAEKEQAPAPATTPEKVAE